MPSIDEIKAIRDLALTFPGLRLLILHGSRADGTFHRNSDWDLAYLADAATDEPALRSGLAAALRSDKIDLADLSRAGGLLRFLVAKHGVLLHEREPGLHEAFCCEAAAFWFDVAAIVRAEHESILAGLG
jgi:predicted nucleotidyltransferase